jgi:hypothetical protein
MMLFDINDGLKKGMSKEKSRIIMAPRIFDPV